MEQEHTLPEPLTYMRQSGGIGMVATLLAFLRQLREQLIWIAADKGEKDDKPQFEGNTISDGEIMTCELPPDDPLVAYFHKTSGAVEIASLPFHSPVLETLKAQGVTLMVPLLSQGELVGLLTLGPRLSDQHYSTDDRALLSTLAIQAAPAVRVAQMIREQQEVLLERAHLNQELRVARLIQRTLLPKDVPTLPGWQLASYYQPARQVGGDFYDFLPFEDGRLGIIIGDVTDKGVPAALVMATTRSILRSVALGKDSPAAVLQQVNDLLYSDIPEKMFVTCLYAILNPADGRLLYANAGHDLPYLWQNDQVCELRATGMPLGLLPGMLYEERETVIAPGDSVLYYSDGLVEAHNREREMFGFPRLMQLLSEQAQKGSVSVIDYLLHELAAFTGPDWEQEDDVTMVSIQRIGSWHGGQQVGKAPREIETSPIIEEATLRI